MFLISWCYSKSISGDIRSSDTLQWIQFQLCSWAGAQVSAGNHWICDGSHIRNPSPLLQHVNFALNIAQTTRKHQRNPQTGTSQHIFWQNTNISLTTLTQEWSIVLPNLKLSPSTTVTLHICDGKFWPFSSECTQLIIVMFLPVSFISFPFFIPGWGCRVPLSSFPLLQMTKSRWAPLSHHLWGCSGCIRSCFGGRMHNNASLLWF